MCPLEEFSLTKKYKVASFSRLEDALKALETNPIDVVLTDMKMQGRKINTGVVQIGE